MNRGREKREDEEGRKAGTAMDAMKKISRRTEEIGRAHV